MVTDIGTCKEAAGLTCCGVHRLRHPEPESPWDQLRKVQADLEDLYAMPYAQHQPLAESNPDTIKAATVSSYIVPPGYALPGGRANPLHGPTRKPLPL